MSYEERLENVLSESGRKFVSSGRDAIYVSALIPIVLAEFAPELRIADRAREYIEASSYNRESSDALQARARLRAAVEGEKG